MDNNQKIFLLEKATEELLSLESRINTIQNRYILDSLDNGFYGRDILNDIANIGSIITELTCTKIPNIITKLKQNQYDNCGNLFGNNGMAIVNQYGRRNNNYIGNNVFQYGNKYNFRNPPRDLNNFVNNKYRYNYRNFDGDQRDNRYFGNYY